MLKKDLLCLANGDYKIFINVEDGDKKSTLFRSYANSDFATPYQPEHISYGSFCSLLEGRKKVVKGWSVVWLDRRMVSVHNLAAASAPRDDIAGLGLGQNLDNVIAFQEALQEVIDQSDELVSDTWLENKQALMTLYVMGRAEYFGMDEVKLVETGLRAMKVYLMPFYHDLYKRAELHLGKEIHKTNLFNYIHREFLPNFILDAEWNGQSASGKIFMDLLKDRNMDSYFKDEMLAQFANAVCSSHVKRFVLPRHQVEAMEATAPVQEMKKGSKIRQLWDKFLKFCDGNH
jgi:hypothetical protein